MLNYLSGPTEPIYKIMKYLSLLILAGGVVAGLSASAAPVDWSKLPPASTNANVTFAADIQPLFKASCVRCHGEKRPRKGLRLDTLEGVLQGSEEGAVVKVGDSANSELVKAISQLDPHSAMPPKRKARPGGAGGPPPVTTTPNGQPVAGAPGGPGGPANLPPAAKMPPPAKPLTADEVGLVRAWIDQGAK